MIAAVAFAAALSAAPDGDLQHMARQPRDGGLIDVGAFNDKAMVRTVAPAPCASRSFLKWPEAGCVRAARHAPARK